MFIPATKMNMSSTNYDYYTLLTIVIVIYMFCINSLHETNKILKKKLEDMEVTIKLNTTNTYDKINKLKEEVEATNLANFNEDLLTIANKLKDINLFAIVNSNKDDIKKLETTLKDINKQLATYINSNKDDIKKLETTLKDLNKKLKLLNKENNDNDNNNYIMTGIHYYSPLLVYKGTDNLLKSILTNYADETGFDEYDLNLILSSLVQFKNVKEIELTKIHKYGNIIDDDGKVIWSKNDDTISNGYDIVVSYLNEYNVKFV